MNLDQLEKFEREQALLAQSRQARADAKKVSDKAQDLPGIRSSGLVRAMSEEEKNAWFAEMYRAVDGEPGPETVEQREFREKCEAQIRKK